MSAATRILVVDDHVVLREALAEFLDRQAHLAVIGQAATGADAIYLCEVERPDVLLIDIGLPDGNGIDVTRYLREKFPDLAVLILSVSDDDRDVLRALQAGARGYLLKSVAADFLLLAIEAVRWGAVILAPELAGGLALTINPSPLDRPVEEAALGETVLTKRESEILGLLREGHSNREIGRILSISESTVKSHVHRLLGKLHASSRTQAAVLAARCAGRA